MKLKIQEIFTAIEQQNISYCLLRGYDELEKSEPFKEIDVLVDPAQLRKLARTLSGLGFVELPNWGHKPHAFFTLYLQDIGTWLKFDVVTELRYGKPLRLYRVALARECLQFRQKRELAFVLAPEHQLITLLLHGLLDKGQFKEAYKSQLQSDFAAAQNDSRASERLNEYASHILAPAVTPQILEQAINTNDWQLLLDQKDKLRKQFHAARPIGYLFRKVATRLVLKLRPVLFMLRRRGISIALLAADGAGKSTLANRLQQDKTLQARLVYMGTNVHASTVGLPTTKWLHQRIKSKNGQLKKPKLANKALRAMNFVNKLLEKWYRIFVARYLRLRGRFVVFDRYIYDSWLVKRPNTIWKKFRRLLFEKGYPRPDLVIFLDAPGQVLFERKGEHSPEWLEQQRQGYLSLKSHIPQMVVVDATRGADEVEGEVKSLIWSHYKFRSGAKIFNGNGQIGSIADKSKQA